MLSKLKLGMLAMLSSFQATGRAEHNLVGPSKTTSPTNIRLRTGSAKKPNTAANRTKAKAARKARKAQR